MAKIKYDKTLVDALEHDTPPTDAAHAAAWTWARTGEGDPSAWAQPLALAAIETARRLGNASALLACKEGNAPKALRKAAGGALHKLRAAGHDVPERRPVQVGLGREAPPPPRGFLGLPDAEGNCLACASWSADDEDYVYAAWIAGPEGVKNPFGGALTRTELRKLWRDLDSESLTTQVDFDVAFHLLDRCVRDAGDANYTSFVQRIPKDVAQSARDANPFARFPTDLDTTALEASGELASELQAGVAVDDQALDEAVQGYLVWRTENRDADKDAAIERIDHACTTILEASFDPKVRGDLALRMEIAALLMSRGWASSCWATAQALRSPDIALRDIPFLLQSTRMEIAESLHLDEGASIASLPPALTDA